jgi:hypothetical protein
MLIDNAMDFGRAAAATPNRCGTLAGARSRRRSAVSGSAGHNFRLPATLSTRLTSCANCLPPDGSNCASTTRFTAQSGRSSTLYERALTAVPVSQRAVAEPRWRIAHAQILSPADMPRFAHLGVIASMQPFHAISDLFFCACQARARATGQRLCVAFAADRR